MTNTNLLANSTACLAIATIGAIPATLILCTIFGLTFADPGAFLIGIAWFVVWLALAGKAGTKANEE